MSDLDKFTLQYQVDLKDSIRKLEELHKKMTAVNKAHSESASKLKEFVSGASEELNKLIPGMNAVGAAARGMGAQFAAVAVAVAAVAVSVKAVMALRAQLNQQLDVGMSIGVSGARIEEYQRKFVRVSGGYVNREQALAGIEAFSKLGTSAYKNPMSSDARRMRELGVKIAPYGSTPTGINEQMTQAGQKLAGMTTQQVQAMAIATGINQEWLLSLQKLGPTIGQVTEHTNAELEARKKADADVAKLNSDMAKFNEQMNRLEIQLGMLVAGPMAKFVEYLADAAGWINKIAEKKPSNKSDMAQMALGGLPGLISGGSHMLGGWIKDKYNAWRHPGEGGKTPEEKSKDALVDALDEPQKAAKTEGDRMGLIIDQFAGAVQSFSSAVNIQQAWAAWAGEIGKAAGLGTTAAANDSSGDPARRVKAVVVGAGAGGDHQSVIQSMMAKGWSREAAAGIAANLYQESKYDPTAVGDSGKAYGIGQWHPDRQANFKKVFGKDIRGSTTDEQLAFVDWELRNTEKGAGDRLRGATSADAAGSIVSRYYERPGDVEGQARYRGAMAGRIVGGGVHGESRSSMQLTATQNTLADYLHVPVEQLQQGKVNRGDAAWALRQKEAGMVNELYQLKQQAATPKGLPAQTYAKLQRDIRDKSMQLNILRQYGSEVVGGQQEGARSLTIGENAIIININGAGDPVAIGQEANDRMAATLNDFVNQNATGTKG